MQQEVALRDVREGLGLKHKLAEQYPHGLTRGMIRRLKLEDNCIEIPGRLGFGFMP